MTSSSVGVARVILRNAAALLLVGVLAKGVGLVIAILIARFLGKDAVGLYAMLFTVSVIVETLISIGMSDSLVRDVAARRSQASNLYLKALTLVLAVSLIPAVVLAIVAFFVDDTGATRASLLVLAISTPVTGAFVVSQAVLQGTERVLLLIWVSFVARVGSLAWLVFALMHGAGVDAAFVSKLLFQLASVVVFFVVLWRDRNDEKVDFTSWSLLTRSLPFAFNRAIRDFHVRLPSLVLPATMGLAPSGVFDAANRIRSTLGMSMGAMIVGLMPSFARSAGDSGSSQLIGFSAKYMCLAMSLAATAIALVADWLIHLFYGLAFNDASGPLQLLIWAQVLVAIDAILQQAMMAAGHQVAAARHSTVGVAGQLALIVPLAWLLDLPGVSLAVMLSSLLALALDLRFVLTRVAAFSASRFVGRPLAAACVVAGTMLALHDQVFVVRVLAAIGAWSIVVPIFGLLPRDELLFMRRLGSLPGVKRSAMPDREA